jgi:hypothetical protein
LTALPPEQAQVELESKKPAPRSYKLIREIEQAMNDKTGNRMTQLINAAAHHAADLKTELTEHRRAILHRPSERHLLQLPRVRENDLIVSSFGKDPDEFNVTGRKSLTEDKRHGTCISMASVIKSTPTKEVSESKTSLPDGQRKYITP